MSLIFSLAYWVFFWIFSTLIVLTAATLLLFGWARGSHAVHLFWCIVMVKVSPIRLVVRGRENMPEVGTRPLVIMANHQSLYDVLILGAALRRQYRWLVKDSLFKIPILGWGMKRTGYVPVIRGDKKASGVALRLALRQLEKGNSLIIFPEGTRSRTGSLGNFQKGGFYTAQKTGAAVLPVVIEGTSQVLPVQKGRRVQRLRPGTVTVTILPPVEPGPETQTRELMEKVRGQYREHLGE